MRARASTGPADSGVRERAPGARVRRAAPRAGPAASRGRRSIPRGIGVDIPGRKRLRITHVVLDFNGTLATDGRLIRGVRARLRRLAPGMNIIVLTADTFGTARRALAGLPVTCEVVRDGAEKRRLVEAIGGPSVAAVGNGANDAPMFKVAGLSIAVCGSESAAVESWRSATVVTRDINDALDLLLKPQRLVATLRR